MRKLTQGQNYVSDIRTSARSSRQMKNHL